MKLRDLALFLALPLAACAPGMNDMQLYPLEGPIAKTDPTKMIEIKVRNTTDTSGSVRFRLSRKVKCEGTWSTVAPKEISRSRGLSLTIRNPGGKIGRDVTTVAGVNNGELYAVCNDGTKVQGNFIIGSGTSSGTGTATDTAGNVFKLLF